MLDAIYTFFSSLISLAAGGAQGLLNAFAVLFQG